MPPSGFEPGHHLFETLKNEGCQHPPYIPFGIYAYRRFLVLPNHERKAIGAGTGASIWPFEHWSDALAVRLPGFRCIGGSHQNSYRDFLARRFFTSYPVDLLSLDAGALQWRC